MQCFKVTGAVPYHCLKPQLRGARLPSPEHSVPDTRCLDLGYDSVTPSKEIPRLSKTQLKSLIWNHRGLLYLLTLT